MHPPEQESPDKKPQLLDAHPRRYLLHGSSYDSTTLAEVCADLSIHELAFGDRESIPSDSCVLLCLGDEQIRDLVDLAIERKWQVGLLPHPDAPQAMAAMGVKGDAKQLLEQYCSSSAIEANVLTCNGELVFSSVVIGRVLALRPDDINKPQTLNSIVAGAFRGLGKLRLGDYRLTTAKDRKIQLGALGMVAAGYTPGSLIGRKFDGSLGSVDGRLSLLALAPRSILSYLWFVLKLFLPRKIQLSRLPSSLALIQSRCIHIEAPRGAEYLLDGKPVHANEIELRVLDERLLLLPGPALELQGEAGSASDKDTVRLNHVPVDEGARELFGKSLPFFNHASEDEYRELFVSLRDSASASASYQVLMILSVLLALSGLYANSAPVIIGAMILAPLMSPIVSLAMGLARSEASLIRGSVNTLLIGIGWGLLCAVLLSLLMPLEIPTQEMRSRMSPTLLDLLVAVISGVAGAYAHAKEEIAKSLAGVAIAVALVPPLSVAGIGVGWGNWEMARGAFLLLTTNLVGIALAGSATFLVLGFAPFKRAGKGLGISFLIMLLISVPLYIAFEHLVQRDRISERVPTGSLELSGRVVNVSSVEVQSGSPPLVRVVLSSEERLNGVHVDALKKIISERVGEPVQVEAELNIRR